MFHKKRKYEDKVCLCLEVALVCIESWKSLPFLNSLVDEFVCSRLFWTSAWNSGCYAKFSFSVLRHFCIFILRFTFHAHRWLKCNKCALSGVDINAFSNHIHWSQLGSDSQCEMPLGSISFIQCLAKKPLLMTLAKKVLFWSGPICNFFLRWANSKT